MAKGDDLEDRLIRFAVRIVKLTEHLPKTAAGRHFSGQLLRSGTSPALNYAEARRAESQADFIHKMKVVLKELNETRVCLIIISLSELLPAPKMGDIINEASELCRIFGTAVKTSQSNRDS